MAPLKFSKPKAKAVSTKEIGDKKSKEVLSTDEQQHEVDTSSVADPSPAVEQLCVVGVKAGYTKNLSNFQFARYDVSIDIPCKHAEIEEVFAFASEWVDDKLSSMVSDDED